MTTRSLYPNIAPSLSLDFANTKALDPRITFARASTARVYDGKTVAKAEENLLIRSQEFNDAVWLAANLVITANNAVAPDGTTTAETVNEGTANGVHHFQQAGFAYTSGLAYTLSVFAKADTANVIQLTHQSTAFGTNAFANFDLTNGVLGTVASSATATITNAGAGWYRCTLTATATSTTTQNAGFIFLADNSTTAVRAPSYTGTSRQLFLWGAQLEQRSSVTAYTPTTTQPITNYVPVLLSAANNVARFDHNPVTGESLGLLIEEQRTNLVVRSEEFDNASWSIGNTTTTINTAISPAGTQTVDTVTENSVAAVQFVKSQSGVSISAGASCTWSMYVRRGVGSLRGFRLEVGGGTSGFRANFNPDTGATTSSSTYGAGVVTASGFVDVGNGWRRYFVSGTAGSETSIDALFRFTSAATGSTIGYTGDGIQSFQLWGAQLEAGAFPTSYIPTVASQVTRSADAASMTGANFSSWYRADEGTLYAEAAAVPLLNTPSGVAVGAASINNGASSNRIDIRLQSGGSSFVSFISDGGTNQAVLTNSGTYTPNTFYKVGLAYRVNDFARVNNGGTAATDTAGSVPVSVDRLSIGVLDGGNSGGLNGTIKKIAFYPRRISNAELQALTQI